METWKTEVWQTMCPDGDREVAKIFRQLHDKELTPIQAFAQLENVPNNFPDAELCKETINPFFEHAIEAGYSDEELTEAYESVRYDEAYKEHLSKEKMKVWIYVWKACRNHNEESPSNSDYILVDIENYFGIEKYESKDKETVFDGFSESWADNVDKDGFYHGYSYGWSFKEPSKEWLLEKIEREKKNIESIEVHIKSLQKYIK